MSLRPLCLAALSACALLAGCHEGGGFDPAAPALGPGAMVGNGAPITDGNFVGGDDLLPAARAVVTAPQAPTPPDCQGDCVRYCDAAALKNPVNAGLCRSLWGVGLTHKPIVHDEACRRLFVDMKGRLPTQEEAQAACTGGWGATVKRLMEDEAFVFVNQRRAADRFLYSTEVVSVERIFDMDRLVGKLYRGLIPYDLFAAVASAHPVLTRRYADPGDTTDALFKHFLGRPPFEHERADMRRLYAVWARGYSDHPTLNMRLPDAFIRFRCLDEDGNVDENERGACTSVLWGFHELIFTPDVRATRDPQMNQLTMWSGFLRPEEWARLQTPGRVLAGEVAFWEKAVDDVMEQYLGSDLASQLPEVRQELVEWVLRYNGDIRSVHYAVATSALYLQSSASEPEDPAVAYRWSYGPLKQLEAEAWIDSMAHATGYSVAGCDHRISRPEDFLEAKSVSAYRLLQASSWKLDEEGEVESSYSELARTLGGCPENVVGGRFKVVSILTTATQLNFVARLCNPAGDSDEPGAAVEKLLPADVSPARALTQDLAEQIATHQYRLFLGRAPTAEEVNEARGAGELCALSRCSAQDYARPVCFALLSSAQMLFY